MKIWSRIRIIALLLLSMTLLSDVSSAVDNFLIPRIHTDSIPFTDISNSWCSDAVEICYQTGILAGKTENKFSSESPLTYAQITVIAARLQSILSGGSGVFRNAEKGEAWFIPAYQSLLSAAQKTGKRLPDALLFTEYHSPSDPCSRTAFVDVLSAALDVSDIELPRVNHVSVLPDTVSPTILSFYEGGILNGLDRYGTFRGNDSLNRGQAAAMLARIIAPKQRLKFTLASFDLCKDVFGEEPDTVLFTSGETAYSVSQYSEYIVGSILATGIHAEVNDATILSDSLAPFCSKVIAVEKQASALGITLTLEEKTSLQRSANAKDGYKGLASDYWYWSDSISLLTTKLDDYYRERSGSDEFGQPQELYQALTSIAEQCYAEIQISDHLIKMDVQEMRLKSKDFPVTALW